MNPFTEEASKRQGDTSEEYLKWKFSKEGGKKGLYWEYKPVSTENSLVMIKFLYCEIFRMTIFCVEERPHTTLTLIIHVIVHARNFNQTAENPRYSIGSNTRLCCLLPAAQC
jgi:hypothetical protein